MVPRNKIVETAEPEGRLGENIVHFARSLRKAGLNVGPASVTDAINAVLAAGIGSRDDFYWTLHAVLVKRHEDHAVFDEAFRLFWRSRELVEKMLAMLSPVAPAGAQREKPRSGEKRAADALAKPPERERKQEPDTEIEIDARFSLSASEVLRSRDFAQMSADELELARRAMRKMIMPHDRVKTRRHQPVASGRRMDPRAMMRQGLRTGGDLILPRFTAPRSVQPPLVVLADISGSMSQYSRIFLHFLHVLSERRRHVHSFVFGTRLTNLTRQLRHRDPDEALAECTKAVEDWSGGTRIGEALHVFNKDWSRRVLGQGATVILMTDGLERDRVDLLKRETERLSKSCRRLIWVNPLLRFDGFEPKARGVRVMLPHVDEFRPVHSLEAISDLCDALSGSDRKAWKHLANPHAPAHTAGPGGVHVRR